MFAGADKVSESSPCFYISHASVRVGGRPSEGSLQQGKLYEQSQGTRHTCQGETFICHHTHTRYVQIHHSRISVKWVSGALDLDKSHPPYMYNLLTCSST